MNLVLLLLGESGGVTSSRVNMVTDPEGVKYDEEAHVESTTVKKSKQIKQHIVDIK